MTSAPVPRQPNRLTSTVGGTIFLSRWLQAPLYLGLIVAQAVYVAHFMKELVHLVTDFSHLGETEIMLIVLGLVDVVMIANLLVMVIIGGYETFVSRIRMNGHPDQPEWLSHVNPNVLKVKLAMSIIGISSVHLLKTFIEAGERDVNPITGEALVTPEMMLWQTIIHLAFIVSAVALAYIDSMAAKTNAVTAAMEAQYGAHSPNHPSPDEPVPPVPERVPVPA